MSGWPILDVAIGLVFVYLLLSMICTTVNEGIMTQMRSRAKFLDRGILALLGSDAAKRAFFKHPIIASYANPKGDSVPRRIMRKLHLEPDHVDKCPSYLSAFAFARAIHDMLRDPATGRIATTIADEAKAAQHPELSGTLRAVLADAKSADDELKLLKAWYNDGMDRVTGWYKRHTQAWVRALAVIIAITLNADTIVVAKKLWDDPTTRAKVVEAAIARSKNPPKTVNYPIEDETSPETNTGEVGTDKDQTVGATDAGLTDTEKQVLGELIGWDAEKIKPAAYKGFGEWIGTRWSFAWSVTIEHWLGWLLTAIAVSLGAPFWFDLLKKLINIRNAGTSPEEKEKKDAA